MTKHYYEMGLACRMVDGGCHLKDVNTLLSTLKDSLVPPGDYLQMLAWMG
jgi:hypothetical protein